MYCSSQSKLFIRRTTLYTGRWPISLLSVIASSVTFFSISISAQIDIRSLWYTPQVYSKRRWCGCGIAEGIYKCACVSVNVHSRKICSYECYSFIGGKAYSLATFGLSPYCLNSNSTLPLLPTFCRMIHIPKEMNAKEINIYTPTVASLKTSCEY